MAINSDWSLSATVDAATRREGLKAHATAAIINFPMPTIAAVNGPNHDVRQTSRYDQTSEANVEVSIVVNVQVLLVGSVPNQTVANLVPAVEDVPNAA
jgi:hypothetical protein